MELNERQIELVGLYLQGRLKGDDLSNFLAEVEQNALLKKELQIQQAIQDGIEHRNNQELRDTFKKIAAEEKESTKDSRMIPIRMFKILSSIAAVSVLCFAAYFLLKSPSDTQSLYADYYKPSELTITRSTDLKEDLVKVKELYNTKKYERALPLFKNLIDENPDLSNLRLAYANTLLTCQKINLARQQFNYIIESEDPLFSDQSKWYLSLLELKAGNIQKCKENLSDLTRDVNSDFYTEAKALLLELEELD